MNSRPCDPEQLLVLYLATRQRLGSCIALTVETDPRSGGDPNGAELARVRLADLAWYAIELTPFELQVAELRLLGHAGVESTVRYLQNLADMKADESPTGAHHPSDELLRQVIGVRAKRPTYQQLAGVLGCSFRDVRAATQAARRKVGERLARRPWPAQSEA